MTPTILLLCCLLSASLAIPIQQRSVGLNARKPNNKDAAMDLLRELVQELSKKEVSVYYCVFLHDVYRQL